MTGRGRAFPTWARGGEGALAPSCRVPQGHDHTPLRLLNFFSKFLLAAATRRQNGEKRATANFSSRRFLYLRSRRKKIKKSKQEDCGGA